MSLPIRSSEPLLPTSHDMSLAAESSHVLAAYIDSVKSPIIQLTDAQGNKKDIQLPAVSLQLLLDALNELKEGKGVTLVTVQEELTTQEAAEILNVSRPFLVKLLDQGDIPSRKVGSKRRVLAKDILSYKTKIIESRQHVLDKLAQKSQDLNLGYE